MKYKKLTKKQKEEALAIHDRFEEAVYTLKRMRIAHTRPMAYFNTWPDIVYTEWEIMLQERLDLKLGPPSPQAIDRMEEVFDWLQWVTVEERNLIWWRAKRVYWETICEMVPYCRQTAWRKWSGALYDISCRLKTKQNKRK